MEASEEIQDQGQLLKAVKQQIYALTGIRIPELAEGFTFTKTLGGKYYVAWW